MLCAFLLAHLPSPSIAPKLASRYFQEAKWMAEDDGGALWGRDLYGSMVFVDPATREAVTNRRPPDGSFRAEGDVFVGKLAEDVPVANTSIDWKGTRWTMVMWPLPTDRTDRSVLMMHELYHRLQPELGMPGSSPQNAHMDTLEGRLWLQLELKALASALSGGGREAAQDALAFRAKRQRLFPSAKSEEDALELNEGLAEFTGAMFRGGSEAESRLWLANQLRGAMALPSYSRRFPYLTGTAYAMLLNAPGGRWRNDLNSDSSLADEFQKASGVKIERSASGILSRAKAYGYAEIRAREMKRDAEHRSRVAAIRKRLIDGPVLRIDSVKMQISFNPGNVVPLGKEGTYYPTATIIDDWGKLEAGGGALVSADWSSVQVSAPKAGANSGEGWKLALNPGWRIVAGKRAGSFLVAKEGG